ncbi:SH3 domain-containing protein [Candidatus Uabimicrobium sp. HlEnr_7]|uniref:SH3 domain-containing protein n=1 Tax=Candidatus Uabimicrobium helgolandensis TaxID=3095367 RepID=UPI003558442C
MRLMIFCILFVFLGAGFADTLYIKSKTAPLRKHPRKKKTVAKAKRGEKVKKIKKVRKWIRIKYNGKKLWVYKGKVSKKAPKKDTSLLTANYADDVAAGSAVRGLSKVALKFSSSQSVSPKHQSFMDYHQSFIATDKSDFTPQLARGIQLVKITSEMLEKFQEDGKVGSYADPGDEGEFEEE